MIDWKSKIDNAKDLYQIYWDGDHKYIRIYGYFYDEGQNNGNGSTRFVEYYDFNVLLIEFIQYGFEYDEHTYSENIYDYLYDEAVKKIKHHFGRNIKIKELSLSELNMDTPEGYYVDM